jgi:hypothetical protein
VKIAVLLVGVAVGLYLLDRFLLSCESRGWIYYRTKKASPGSASPFLDLLTIYSPSQRHVLERRMDEQEERQDEDKDGGRLDDDTDGAPSTDQQA